MPVAIGSCAFFDPVESKLFAGSSAPFKTRAGSREVHYLRVMSSDEKDPSALEAPMFSEPDSKDDVTNWKAIYIAGVVGFLAAVENTVVGMAEWPYMHTVDPEETLSFFGVASSISKWGHVVASLLFSLWTYKSQTVRWQLILGRFLAFAGCCIYLCVEFLPSGRRYLMLFCYIIFSIASSSSVILRVYIVLVSSNEDRSRAFATTSLAHIISIIIGPVIQLAFSGISYPGYEILPNVRFHIYSAPIWLATLTNVFSVLFIYYALEEMPKREKKPKKEKEEFDYSLEALKKRINKIRSLDVRWSLIILCLVERLVLSLSPGTLGTVVSPIFMATFGWDAEFTVTMTSIAMGAVGILSVCIGLMFMATKLPKIVPPRVCFLIGLCISVALYVTSYPYPLTSHYLPAYNATTRAGCNPLEYDWCTTAKGTWPIIFIPVVVLVMGLGQPMSMISIDTIYSKIAANADQSIMQGLVVVAEDLMMVIGPLYAATMFSSFGQSPLWMCNGAFTIAGIVAWAFFFPRLSEY